MKVRKYSNWRMIAIAMLALQSCSLDDSGKETVIQVDEEFKINLNETLGTSRQFLLELESVENEDCLNSTIDLSYISQPTRITLNLNGIKTANDCNPGIAPARSTINAGTTNNGDYPFWVVVGNTVENEGKLSVTDSKYELNMFSTDGILLTNSVLYRIPDQTVWGFVAYNDAAAVGAAPAEFIADLESMTEPRSLSKGYYGQFELNDLGALTLKTPPQQAHLESFLYQYNGNIDELKALLQDYRTGPAGNAMQMVIYTADGKVL